MIFILFLLGVCQASRLESYIRTLECNIEVVTDLTSVSFDQPFILRRGKEHLNTIQEEMNIDKLLSSIGDKIVGVDYPGDETKSWIGTSFHRVFRHHSEGIKT